MLSSFLNRINEDVMNEDNLLDEKSFKFIPVSKSSLDIVTVIAKSNDYYYETALGKIFEEQDVIDDINALPPGKLKKDKAYVVLVNPEELPVLLLDIIDGYPDEYALFIGLFMINGCLQGKGLGNKILSQLLSAAKYAGLTRIELGCIERNERGMLFWQREGFEVIRKKEMVIDKETHIVYSLSKKL